MNVKDALEDFYLSMDGVLSQATIKWYHSRLASLVSFLGEDTLIETVTLNDLRKWRALLAGRTERWSGHSHRPPADGALSPESIHAHVRACQRLFKWLQEEEIIQKDPARRLEKPQLQTRKKKGIPDADRDAIIAAAYKSSERDYAIVLILADTACRVGGLAGLKVEDLEIDKRRALVTEKGKGGGKTRRIYFSHRSLEALQQYLKHRPASSDPHVFLHEYKPYKHLKENGIYQLLKRLAREVGVPDGWNPHNWRHGAIRGMLDNGMPLPAVSEIAGHSSTQITGDIYGSYPEVKLQEMHDRYTWLPDGDRCGQPG